MSRRVVIVPERRVAYFAIVVDDETGERLYQTEAYDDEAGAVASAKSALNDDETLTSVQECRESA